MNFIFSYVYFVKINCLKKMVDFVIMFVYCCVDVIIFFWKKNLIIMLCWILFGMCLKVIYLYLLSNILYIYYVLMFYFFFLRFNY